MSRDFPDWVDPAKAAAARREFHGTVPLARLERLEGLLADDRGVAEFQLAFSEDGDRQVRVDIRVSAEVSLICQRSLQPYQEKLDARSVVGIVADDAAAAALPSDYEPVICADNRVWLMRLVEEELLLALPLIPRDPQAKPVRCEQPDGGGNRPFAGLAKLKRKSGQ